MTRPCNTVTGFFLKMDGRGVIAFDDIVTIDSWDRGIETADGSIAVFDALLLSDVVPRLRCDPPVSPTNRRLLLGGASAPSKLTRRGFG